MSHFTKQRCIFFKYIPSTLFLIFLFCYHSCNLGRHEWRKKHIRLVVKYGLKNRGPGNFPYKPLQFSYGSFTTMKILPGETSFWFFYRSFITITRYMQSVSGILTELYRTLTINWDAWTAHTGEQPWNHVWFPTLHCLLLA